jgi:hypothetical protein
MSKAMKVFCLSIFILLTFFGCEKDISPEEKKQQELGILRTHLINDWKIFRIMTVKPASQYGAIGSSFCEDVAIFSFKIDGTFMYSGNPTCYSIGNLPGVWDLPKPDSLFIHFTGSWAIGAYENLEITKLTADTLKWNIVGATGNGNPLVTIEYTLVPR